MDFVFLSMENIAREISDCTGIALDIARCVACYSHCGLHSILKSDPALCHVLRENEPHHPCLEYHRPGSHEHTTISRWCSGTRDMVKDEFGWSTRNKIAYCPEEKSYLHSDYSLCKRSVPKQQIEGGILRSHKQQAFDFYLPGDPRITLFESWHFSDQTVRQLEERGVISQALTLEPDFRY